MRHEIVNCTWKFKFQCPRRWEGLRQTDDANVRMCESCLKPVHRCQSEEEVAAHAAKGHCVALGFWRNGEELGLLGEVAPDS